MWPNVAWRLFWRELKRGELWVIAFALCLAVFTVVSLSGITESVRSALSQRSANFIAAVLTKTAASISTENEGALTTFNQILALWRHYLQQGMELYLAEPLAFDKVDVSGLFAPPKLANSIKT